MQLNQTNKFSFNHLVCVSQGPSGLSLCNPTIRENCKSISVPALPAQLH